MWSPGSNMAGKEICSVDCRLPQCKLFCCHSSWAGYLGVDYIDPNKKSLQTTEHTN